MWERRRIRVGRVRKINEVDLLQEAVKQKEDVKGCEHYQRRCRIAAPCCDQIFWCRLCHDSHFLEDISSNTFHQLNRFAVQKCVCDDCGLEQPASKSCVGCNVTFARYFCPICNLWDDDPTKGIWHCTDCGLCRRGGQDNFFHCANCDVCVPREVSHKCLPNALRDKCPICLEDMFSSIRLVTYMSGCGHALHRDCLESLAKSGRWNGCCSICNAPFRTQQPSRQELPPIRDNADDFEDDDQSSIDQHHSEEDASDLDQDP